MGNDQPRLDSLAQPDLIGQQGALGQRVLTGEQRGVDLMRVQIDTGIEQRLRNAADAIVVLPAGESVRIVLGLVRGDQRLSSSFFLAISARDVQQQSPG